MIACTLVYTSNASLSARPRENQSYNADDVAKAACSEVTGGGVVNLVVLRGLETGEITGGPVAVPGLAFEDDGVGLVRGATGEDGHALARVHEIVARAPLVLGPPLAVFGEGGDGRFRDGALARRDLGVFRGCLTRGAGAAAIGAGAGAGAGWGGAGSRRRSGRLGSAMEHGKMRVVSFNQRHLLLDELGLSLLGREIATGPATTEARNGLVARQVSLVEGQRQVNGGKEAL